MKAFFYSIKFRLPGVQNRQSPLSPLLFFLLNKARYKNKYGGDLPKSPITNLFEISPPITMHNIDDPTRWRAGRKESREEWPNPWFDQATADSLSFRVSSSFNDGMCNSTLTNSLKLPNFLSLNNFFADHKN